MAFKEQEKIDKDYSEELITELINYQGDNLIEKIVGFGLQKLMERGSFISLIFCVPFSWIIFCIGPIISG